MKAGDGVYAAVVLDLDGTLLNSEKKISERNFASVLECHRRGVKIIFATARPPRTVRILLPDEMRDIGSFIYYNGALVVSAELGITLHEAIPSDLAGEVIDFCLGRHAGLGEEAEWDVGVEALDEWYGLKEPNFPVPIGEENRYHVTTLTKLKMLEATKILLAGPAHVEQLRETFGHRLNIIVTDQGQLVQIMAGNASKERGLARLLDGFGIPAERVIAFGDDHNDIGLFKVCGWPVAMGNAVEELKRLARSVTETNDRDGVAVELERLLRCE
ncbi:MAG: hypothetical protein BAA02_10115 [Paenibacillaceae bacterium ZCTH02-B3]|nr:MAG: hypothetical protein BAA02_10115 [Paenibacillaceae bacterium ZCTH02-B3]